MKLISDEEGRPKAGVTKSQLATALQCIALVTWKAEQAGHTACVVPEKPCSHCKKDDSDLSKVMRSLENSAYQQDSDVTVAPAVMLPKDHNPFLEKCVVRELLLMDSSKFRRIIKCRLSPKEINFIMQHEHFRLKSFDGDWMHEDNETLCGKNMANAGFYNCQETDSVRCPFCKLELGQWRPNMRPKYLHDADSTNCPFVRAPGNCGNVPLPQQFQYGGHISRIGDLHHPELYGVNRERSVAPLMSRHSMRRNSFNDEEYPAPQILKQMISILVESGFYYTRYEDLVACFECGLKLHRWREGDDPWREHIMYVSDCPHILQNKEKAFIDGVLSSLPVRRTSMEIFKNDDILPDVGLQEDHYDNHAITTGNENLELQPDNISNLETQPINRIAKDWMNNLTCKVCLDVRVGIIFLPCAHMVCCIACAAAMKECPICRANIKGTIKIAIPT